MGARHSLSEALAYLECSRCLTVRLAVCGILQLLQRSVASPPSHSIRVGLYIVAARRAVACGCNPPCCSVSLVSRATQRGGCESTKAGGDRGKPLVTIRGVPCG